MNIGKDKQHILTANKYFSFVFKYRKNLFPVIVECTHSILLRCNPSGTEDKDEVGKTHFN